MQSRIPGWVWIFTLTIVAGFVGFLFFLSQVPDHAELDTAQAKNGLKDLVNETLENNLPKLGPDSDSGEGLGIKLPELDFYRLLTEQEVATLQTDEPLPERNSPEAQSAQNNLAWVLQAGSFRKETDAESLRADLILRGLTSTHIERADLAEKGIFYRVMIGPIADRSMMNRAKDILVDADIAPIERRVTLAQQQ